ncbi:tripartite-type tricarboxylate transporter receptor subunit TctC [Variovorax guangxiensis]|uniref:Tripartite-type tricarboxylate transporter receptor subunit TctC n=1 Tax=Variovorax guangxiensis TaxID=1775474 RepID=A0A840FQ48_9BURK|nr:tripartite-type tricarboxylate transporter receptor subunit TctC [Variovorax guangxiensis]
MKAIRRMLAACLLVAGASAQAAFPERPITLVVPYAPGGSADALARVVAVRVGMKLGTSVIVDNRPGASGTIGAGFAAKAAPDGYTVLYDATPYSINPHLFARMPYAATALQPLALVALAPNIVIVRADSPLKSIKDLADKAKAEPGKDQLRVGR